MIQQIFFALFPLSMLCFVVDNRIWAFESSFNINTIQNHIYHHRRRQFIISPSTSSTSTNLRMIFDGDNYNTNTNNDNDDNYYDGNDSSSSSSDPDMLLKMVEELTMAVDEVTPELYEKMESVELALAKFLEEKSNALSTNIDKPPPPSNPPPMGALYNRNTLSNDLIRAEQALEKLRQRLRQEEEALFQAEQVLQRSMEEQDILRRAEEALQQSRKAAEQRKAEAIRQTGMAMEAVERSLEEQQQQTPPPPRPTMELGNIFGGRKRSSSSASQGVPDGIPILYNWIQYDDGSIRGTIKGSPNFVDGATISTSTVELGAQGGSIITTSSGSQ